MNADAAQDVRGDQDRAAGRSGRRRRRRPPRTAPPARGSVRISRLTAVFDPVDFDDDDGQPEEDHVAADLGRRLRQPEAQEGRVAEDRRARRPALGAARAAAGGRPAPVTRRPPGPGAPRAAFRAGSPRATNSTRRRSIRRPLDQDVAAAGLAAQPDVGARAGRRARCRRRTDGARRRRTTSPRSSVEDGSVRHRRVRVSEARVGRGPGRGRASVAGSSIRSTGVTVDDDVGLGRRQLGDDAAGPASASRSACPGRRSPRSRTGRRAAPRRRRRRPAAPLTTTPGTIRTSPRSRSPRRRRCAAR